MLTTSIVLCYFLAPGVITLPTPQAPRQGEASDELARLIGQLGSADRKDKLAAIRELGKLEERALPSLSALEKLVEEDDTMISCFAAIAIPRISPERGSEYIPKLMACLGEGNPGSVLYGAAKTLGGIGRPAVAALVSALDDGHGQISRSYVCAALEFIGPDATEGVSALSRVLREGENPALREAAATALGAIGSGDAQPALSDAAADDSGDVRRAAAASLAQLSGTEAGAWQSSTRVIAVSGITLTAVCAMMIYRVQRARSHSHRNASGDNFGDP